MWLPISVTATAAKMAGTLAESYARVLLAWHRRHGTSRLDQRFPEHSAWQQRYREALAEFAEADPSDPKVQLALASEQLAGSMEWAYGEAVTDVPGATNLGELARKLRELATPEDRDCRFVSVDSREQLMDSAARFYGRHGSERAGISDGLSFFVSTSLERAAPGANSVVLLSPEVLGIAPAPDGRPDDLIEHAFSGDLEIEAVTGETIAEAL